MPKISKRTIIIAAALAAIFICACANAQEFLLGDANGDGKVDVRDAVLVLRSSAGLVKLSSQAQLAADVNGDGKVNALDAILILRYAAGVLKEFPAKPGADNHPPAGSIKIQNGALYTNSSSVKITLNAQDNLNPAEQLKAQFSNDGLNWSDFQNYSPELTWQLSPGDGEKQVFTRFKDPAGNLSAVVSAKIILDTQAPSLEIIFPQEGQVIGI